MIIKAGKGKQNNMDNIEEFTLAFVNPKCNH